MPCFPRSKTSAVAQEVDEADSMNLSLAKSPDPPADQAFCTSGLDRLQEEELGLLGLGPGRPPRLR